MVPLLGKLTIHVFLTLNRDFLIAYTSKDTKNFFRIVRQHNCGRNEKRERKVEMVNK